MASPQKSIWKLVLQIPEPGSLHWTQVCPVYPVCRWCVRHCRWMHMEMQAGSHSKPETLIHRCMWELYSHFLYKVDDLLTNGKRTWVPLKSDLISYLDQIHPASPHNNSSAISFPGNKDGHGVSPFSQVVGPFARSAHLLPREIIFAAA